MVVRLSGYVPQGVGRVDAEGTEVQSDLTGSESAEGPGFGLRDRFLGVQLTQELHLRFVCGQRGPPECRIGIAVDGRDACDWIARDVM